MRALLAAFIFASARPVVGLEPGQKEVASCRVTTGGPYASDVFDVDKRIILFTTKNVENPRFLDINGIYYNSYATFKVKMYEIGPAAKINAYEERSNNGVHTATLWFPGPFPYELPRFKARFTMTSLYTDGHMSSAAYNLECERKLALR